MSDSMHSMILRRMTGRQAGDTAEMPLTSSRAVRLAFTKAANDTVGLVLTVLSMGEETLSLDDLLAGLDDKLMLIGLERGDQLAGLFAVDMQLRAAIVEMQTTGRLTAAKADDRPATGTDRMMCDPVLIAFLKAFPAATVGSEFDGWIDGAKLADRIANTRAAGLVLDDQDYRILRLSIDLGVAEREGQVIVVLPPQMQPKVAEPVVTEQVDWATSFQAAVADAPGELDALLHRFKMPLAQAQDLKVGQVLPLRGCTVNSVHLMSPDGHKIAQAKLGQLGGMRAARVEAAPVPHMRELSSSEGMELPQMIGGDQVGLDRGDLLDQGSGGMSPLSETALMEGLTEEPLVSDAEVDTVGEVPMAAMDMDAMLSSD